MLKKLREKLIGQPKEKWLLALALVGTVIMSLWIIQGGQPEASNESNELGLTIPKGFLIVPLELANARAIDGMISHNGIVDVFLSKQNKPMVENLRIVKLESGEGALFGALVPEKNAGLYQEYFSRPHLRAAVRTLNSGPTKFNGLFESQTTLTQIEIREN